MTVLTDHLGPNFTWDERPDANTVAFIADPAVRVGFDLVAAPYADPRMSDVTRYAVVVGDQTIGRVVQCGPRTWEAFNSDASHLFGKFRSAELAAAYLIYTIEL